MNRITGVFCSIVLAVATGCGGPYLVKSDELASEPQPQRALLTTAVVDANACKSGARVSAGSMGDKCGGGLAAFFQAGQLDDFGETMVKRATVFLADNGIELYVDPEHARKIVDQWVEPSEGTRNISQVAGLWISMDGSSVRLPGRPPMALYRHLFKRLDTPEPNEAFVFMEARISKKSAWFGFWKKPRVEIDIGVYDEKGDPLLQSRTVGYGKGSFLFVNNGAKNLELAMTRGLDDLAERTGEGPSRVAAATPPDDGVATATEPDASNPDGVPPDPEPAQPTAEAPDTPAPADPNARPLRSLADRGSSESEPVAAPASGVKEKSSSRRRGKVEPSSHRVGGGVLLGLGGVARPVYTSEQRDALPPNFEPPSIKLETGTGGFLQYEFVPSPYFSFGARGEYYSWISEGESMGEEPRHKLLNIDPMIRARVPIRASLLYLGARFGPSITIPSSSVGDRPGSARAGFGYNYGVVGGIDVLGNGASPSVFVEAGYTGQQVRYHIDPGPLSGADDTLRLRFWQVGFNLGVTYGF